MTLPLVALQRCSLTLGGRQVLSEVSWQLDPGRHWAFLGPNGSGKTTLLAMIRGDLWPDPGGMRSYCFDGLCTQSPIRARERIARLSPEQQEIYRRNEWNLPAGTVVQTGVSQTPFLYTPLTRDQRLRVQGLMERLGVSPLAKRPFLELARGRQRAVLAARALAGQPDVLIVDELLLGLDSRARGLVLAVLEKTTVSGVSILCSGHDEDAVPPWVTHELRLDRGRVARQGRVEGPEPPLAPRSACGGRSRSSQDAGPPAIVLRGAEVRIKGRRVLHIDQWVLRQGEHTLVTGQNGSGKTTLLRLLRGDLSPYAGKGVERPLLPAACDAWCRRQAIGYACPEHQVDMLDPDRTAADLLEQSLRAARLSPLFNGSPGRGAAEGVAAILGLGDFANQRYRALSFGQKQRVVLARAVVRRPWVLLLDEPLSGLDPEGRDVLRRLLEGLARGGVTLVCASHDRKGLPVIFHQQVRLERGEATAVPLVGTADEGARPA